MDCESCPFQLASVVRRGVEDDLQFRDSFGRAAHSKDTSGLCR